MPLTRHKVSGVVADVPQHLIDHPTLGKDLEVVPEGTKSFVPELFKPRTTEKRAEAVQPSKAKHDDAEKKDRK